MDFPDPSLNTDPNYFHLNENRRWENYEGINKYFFLDTTPIKPKGSKVTAD
jgi:hypothetical protein